MIAPPPVETERNLGRVLHQKRVDPVERKKPNPVDAPRPFSVEELFFSTTDPKGIIRTGNEVFRRISGYAESALIGQPHNIIRHPEMPRAVFRLVWEYLKRGKSVAGYVKNMAADGQHYWVVAMLMPLPEGYLSVRFKPTSEVFTAVQGVYAEMLRIERESESNGKSRAAGMDLSSEHLAAALSKLGFSDYDSFMAVMLHSELKSRDAAISSANLQLLPQQIPPSSNKGVDYLRAIFGRLHETYRDVNLLYSELDEFSRLNTELNRNCEGASTRSHEFRLTALNATIQAAQLGHAGRTIGVVAHHLEEIATQIGAASTELVRTMAPVEAGVRSAIFNLAAARLQLEMVIIFCHELAKSSDSNTANYRNLVALESGFTGSIRPATKQLIATAATVGVCEGHGESLRKHTVMMQVAQVVGSVETSHLGGDSPLGQMLLDVRTHTSETRSKLDALLVIMGKFMKLSQSTPAMVEKISGALQLTQRDMKSLLALVDLKPAAAAA